MRKIAILITNLGGPLEQKDVRGFLYNLFADPYIISIPAPFRQLLATLISTTRAKSARKNYAKMGGGSPILAETKKQALALETALKKAWPETIVKVFIGMRYWHPFIKDTITDIHQFGSDELIILPLYPQFSSTTTLTAIQEIKKRLNHDNVNYTCCYAKHPLFVQAQRELINNALKDKNIEDYRLLFSAHGLPEKIIKAGDPYQDQVETGVSFIMQGLESADFQVCYQSRVGPLKWIGPSLDEALAKAANDKKSVIIIPIAFVSEHIETLVELDEEYAEKAEHLGIEHYIRVPTIRDHPLFIEALVDLATRLINKEVSPIGDGPCSGYKYCPKTNCKNKINGNHDVAL
jgi:ferrochelatase